MSRQTAIAKYCFECSGESHANQVLCSLTDCPLWAYRLNGSARKRKERIEYYWGKLDEQGVADFAGLSLDMPFFLKNRQLCNQIRHNRRGPSNPTWLRKKED